MKGLYAKTIQSARALQKFAKDASNAGGANGSVSEEGTATAKTDDNAESSAITTSAAYNPKAAQTYTARGVMAQPPAEAGGVFETVV
jgi:hypothetical protein